MFLERFINFLKYEKNYSVHSIHAYERDIRTYLDYLTKNGFQVQDATHHQIRAFLAQLMERKLQPRSINRTISSLKSFHKFLLREQIIDVNPVALVKMLKTPKNLPHFIPSNDIIKMLDSEGGFSNDFQGYRDRVVVEILFGTGVRRSELLQISEHDIDFMQGTIRIFGKGSKERLVPITSSLSEVIKEYIVLKEKHNFNNTSSKLIVTNKGEDAYAELIYQVVRNRLGLISSKQKRSPHVLRHSIATAMLNNGAQLNDIKELLGHSSLASTQVYTHNSVERLKYIYKQAHPKA
ncbi:tyrosine-type recombinase/integrase [Albibacterium profundi]|uniref:Tyrosine-type recombinase/integrase n=1 Tax=Albibacterium profundi TaxID=3134906 RepID=A0ABV5CBC2_9SPHI